MLICKLCQKEFSGSQFINGKKRSLYCRRYCLECSPFGSRNTTELVNNNGVIEPKVGFRGKRYITCKFCNKSYEYSRKNRQGSTATTCADCYKLRYYERIISKRKTTKQHLVNLMGNKCCFCGYNKCLKSLDFHHIDPQMKKYEISTIYHFPLSMLYEELSKTVLVCKNCHYEIHEGLITNEEVLSKVKPYDLVADLGVKPSLQTL